jgi:hypothetical protein
MASPRASGNCEFLVLCCCIGLFPIRTRESFALSERLKHAEHPAASDERWALVQRIAASRHLLKAPQLREILLYISHRSLEENASAITEQEIGCKVLGRRPDFNPNEDNIVRAQVRHLRRKLDEYFNSDGLDEPLILTIPKGAYLPHFEARPVRAGDEPATAPPSGPPPAAKAAWPRLSTVLLSLLAAALAVLSLLLWSRKDRPLRTATTAERQAPPAGPFWSRIFPSGGETSIVVADTCLVIIQDILDVDIPLSEYLRGGYPEKLIQSVSNRQLRAALRLISARQYTSLGDTNVASKLLELSRRYGARTNLRYSRDLSLRQFKTGNFILIGSRRGMPWEQLFEPQLNFALEEDHATRKYRFRNKAPLPGERAVYGLSGAGSSEDTYADVALLPNPGGNGSVLILSGIDMAATEAAGELITGSDFQGVLGRLLKSRPGQQTASRIEILLQAKAMAGTAEDCKIVASRVN